MTPEELASEANIVILATPHREYAKLKVGEEKILVDVWNFYGKGGLF